MSIHPVVAEIDAIDQADATQPHKCDKCNSVGLDFFDGFWLCLFHLKLAKIQLVRRR